MTGHRCFFKVLLGDFSHQLMIPPGFVRQIPSSTLEEKALLGNSQGRTWEVSMESKDDGLFFAGGGWSDFVKDNDLQEFEFLVFRFDGKRRFGVLVFGTCACERRAEEPPPVEKRLQGKHAKRTQADASSRDCLKIERPLELAKTFASDRPYFIKYITAPAIRKPMQLRIPSKFAKTHLPETKSLLVFRNALGRAWTVAFCPLWMRTNGGWPDFVRANKLQVGDCCAFELVAPSELRVRVIEAGRENLLLRLEENKSD